MFTLTLELAKQWHRYARERHAEQEASQCPLCAYEANTKPWSAVVHWIEGSGFKVQNSHEGRLQIEQIRRGDENRLYRFIAGRGDWI